MITTLKAKTNLDADVSDSPNKICLKNINYSQEKEKVGKY